MQAVLSDVVQCSRVVMTKKVCLIMMPSHMLTTHTMIDVATAVAA